jgi:hypothetical protein
MVNHHQRLLARKKIPPMLPLVSCAAGVGFSPSAGNYPAPGTVSCHDHSLFKTATPPAMSTHQKLPQQKP